LTTLSHKLLQMMAAVLSAMGSAQATPPPPRGELPPLGKLIGQLRQDPALRARFSLDPRSVFEETGIDPTPYDLPDRLDENDVDRFLSNWTGARGPSAGSHPAAAVTRVSEDQSGSPHASGNEPKILASPSAPVAAIYGPPPGLRNKLPEPVRPPSPAPVAPVYGPLPGFPARQPTPASPPQPAEPHASSDEKMLPSLPAPVAPVYGPPPGLWNKLPEPVRPPPPTPQPSEPQTHRPMPFGPAHAPVYGPPPGHRTKP
jgi:hypothetical protein